MSWARKQAAATSTEPQPLLVGLELNATRARAVQGVAEGEPRLLPLDGQDEELPLILSLQGRQPQVGRAGVSLCRLSPHLTCHDFLASLGEKQQWRAGRHRLDPARALAIVLAQVQPACAAARGVMLAVPGYLTRAQAMLVAPLAQKARIPLLGTVKSPLAAGFAAYLAEPWMGTALLLDIDDHALSATTIVADGAQLSVQKSEAWSLLNLRAWKLRLINCVADRCIRQSRRDPRECASAEQSLYEQLEEALDRTARGKMVELLMQTPRWYQNLFLRPEEIVAFCRQQVQQTLEKIEHMVSAANIGLRAVFVTHACGRIPGLSPVLQAWAVARGTEANAELSGDFGEDLIEESNGAFQISVLPADAIPRAAHALAARWQRGELPKGPIDMMLPLPGQDAQKNAAGMKRIFRLFSADNG